MANNALEVAQAAGISLDELWSNDRPTTTFTPQTINLGADISAYKLFIVQFYAVGAVPQFHYEIGVVANKPYDLSHCIGVNIVSTGSSAGAYRRLYFASNTTITFEAGKEGVTGVTNNNMAIPVKVYALK